MARRWLWGLMIAVFPCAAVRADLGVRLELQPATTSALVGDTVQFELRAYSNDAVDDQISVMEIILTWDPAVVSFLGNSAVPPAEGGYNWLSSSFPTLGYPLNADLSDGDAMYVARSQLFGASAFASSNGLPVTRFRFDVIAPAAISTVGLPITLEGSSARSQVVGDIPNFNILTGTTGATISTFACVGGLGDADQDGDIDLRDFQSLQVCVLGADVLADVACRCAFDADHDTDVDGEDAAAFVSALVGPSPP